MNPIVFHVASGQSFFTGVALLLLGGLLAMRSGWIWRRLTFLAVFLGILAIAISSTPLPYWLLIVAWGVTGAWAVSIAAHKFVSQPLAKRFQLAATIALGVVWLVAAVWEVCYLPLPHVPPGGARTLTVIGDSVTAGMGESDVSTWPVLLARAHNIEVQDLSGMGFKTGDAVKKLNTDPVSGRVVFVEIGGNDLLGGGNAAKFRRDLDALLRQLCQDKSRQVVMFELPLPPLCGDFGRAQRSLARKHGVLLVPKRVFLSVLARSGATVDTIHLSPAGHQQMCDAVWGLIQSAYEVSP